MRLFIAAQKHDDSGGPPHVYAHLRWFFAEGYERTFDMYIAKNLHPAQTLPRTIFQHRRQRQGFRPALTDDVKKLYLTYINEKQLSMNFQTSIQNIF